MIPAQTGYIKLNGYTYLLAKNKEQMPVWRPSVFPTQEGDPTRNRRQRYSDWSRGIGDSRGAFQGSVEMANYAYLGAIGRMLPGPAINTITTGLGSTLMDFEEVTVPASRVLACGGTKVVEINPSTHVVAATETLTGDLLSLQLWKDDQVAVAAGDAVDYYVRDAAGAYAQNTISKKARCFGISNGRLVKGFENNWASCDSAVIDSVNNWSTDYDIGNPAFKVNAVFGYLRWDFVLKDDGLFTFDDESVAQSDALPDIGEWPSTDNRSVAFWYNLVLLPTRAGLYRYTQGASRPVGIEEYRLNENELKTGFPTAFVAFGHHFYMAQKVGTTTYILLGRRAVDGDTSMGTGYTVQCAIESFTGECRAMEIVAGDNGPELWYGAGENIHWIRLNPDGLPPVFNTSNNAVVTLSPSDFGNPMTIKQFRTIQAYGRNVAAGRTITFEASMDDGAFVQVGSTINALTSGYGEAFWTRGANDSGRVAQLRVTLANDDGSDPVELRDLVVDFEDRPETVPGAVVGIRLRHGDGESGVVVEDTPKVQLERLRALIGGPVVEMTDIYGETYPVRVFQLEGDLQSYYRGEEPNVDLAIGFRKLDYS